MKALTAIVRAVLHSYAEIFFLQSPVVGAILFLTTFLNPTLGVAGILSVLAAYAFAKFLKMDKTFLETGFYTYNALLVGLSIGFLFKISVITIFFVLVAGVLTFVVSVLLANVFGTYFRLPILSIPFAIISSVLYLSVSRYTNLFVTSLYPKFTLQMLEENVPYFLAGYFKSLGAIFFLPNVLAGCIFALLLLGTSRILFFLSLVGYYTGSAFLFILKGSWYAAFADLSNFNFILVAMAVGGVFLIPARQSYWIALVAVLLSTLVLSATEVFWAAYGVPAFTLPFNSITITLLYVLGLVGFPFVAQVIRKTPEETLDHFLTFQKRFPGTLRTLHLPFAGEWTVWQGFDGRWTHKGQLKYAYDFVITDEQGKTHTEDGSELQHYYAYRKPVLSPVRGRVVAVVSHLPDNPIGQVDRENNWGNYVVIYDLRGFYVEISHFAQDSLKVREGDWVEVGSFLGLCGNSGYSPQPHIHVQVQRTAEVGSPTLPFSFVSYVADQEFHANDLPPEKSKVCPVFADSAIANRLSFYLDNTFTYQVFDGDREAGSVSMTVKMAVDGTFYFDTGKGKLYFGRDAGTFYYYRLDGRDPHLQMMFSAAPRIPLIAEKDIRFTDFLPLKISVGAFRRSVLLFFASFHHAVGASRFVGTIRSRGVLEGKVYPVGSATPIATRVVLDDIFGIREIRVGERKMVLVETNFGEG